MAEIGLQRPGIDALVRQGEAAGVGSIWGCALKASLATVPARSTMRANPAGVNGALRSLVNTNGDFGSCCRSNFRSALNSSPRIGCVLGRRYSP